MNVLKIIKEILESEYKLHKRICIAGGVLAYIYGRTKDFTDIDIYVECEDVDENLMIYPTLKYPYKGYQLNKIYVGTIPGNMEHFVYHILKSFDMNICKIGLYINEFLCKYQVIKFPCIYNDLINSDSVDRFIKYYDRGIVRKTFQPYSLILLSYMTVHKQEKNLTVKKKLRR